MLSLSLSNSFYFFFLSCASAAILWAYCFPLEHFSHTQKDANDSNPIISSISMNLFAQKNNKKKSDLGYDEKCHSFNYFYFFCLAYNSPVIRIIFLFLLIIEKIEFKIYFLCYI
jgi:hypothetical protein